MTILLTGGAGFIGSALVPRLLNETEKEIVVVDNLHPQVHGDKPVPPPHLSHDRVRFVHASVTDSGMWDALFTEISVDVVIHLAAETGTGQSLREASRHADVNVLGTAALIDGLSRAGQVPSRIVLASSRAVYGEGAWRDDISGEEFHALPRGAQQLSEHAWNAIAPSGHAASPVPHRASRVSPRPTNVYAATKLAQEQILLAWASAFDTSLVVLRLQNVYGAGQAVGNPYTGVLTYFAKQILSGQPIEVFEGGGIVRDFVHVSDVAAALVLAVMEPLPLEANSVVLDIGSGEAGALLNYATTLAGLAGSTKISVSDQYRLGDVRAASADITEASEILGYKPRIRFAEGAVDLLEWVRTQAGG